MKKVFSPLFADFWRILSTISPRNRTKTYLLFLLMALQSALELFFILTLTYLGAALTSPTMLNEDYISCRRNSKPGGKTHDICYLLLVVLW